LTALKESGLEGEHADAVVVAEVFARFLVNAAAPTGVATWDILRNEPVPDLMVLKREFSEVISGNPQPEDLALVVEIADSSLSFDLTTKQTCPPARPFWIIGCWRERVSG